MTAIDDATQKLEELLGAVQRLNEESYRPNEVGLLLYLANSIKVRLGSMQPLGEPSEYGAPKGSIAGLSGEMLRAGQENSGAQHMRLLYPLAAAGSEGPSIRRWAEQIWGSEENSGEVRQNPAD